MYRSDCDYTVACFALVIKKDMQVALNKVTSDEMDGEMPLIPQICTMLE